MAFCIVGGAHAFAGNTHKVCVQFAVGVFVVEYGQGISAVGQGFIAVFWEAVSGRVEVTHASNVWRDSRRNHPQKKTLGNSRRLPMDPLKFSMFFLETANVEKILLL
jgi:hypothetical protein